MGPPNVKVFVRYVVVRAYRNAVTKGYRVYVTESLRLIPQAEYLSRGWADITYGSLVRRDDRTAEEIADDVVSRLEGVSS